MINLSFFVDNVNIVGQIYDSLDIQRYPSSEFDDTTYITDLISIPLLPNITKYSYLDIDGTDSDWYRSRYTHTTSSGIIDLYTDWSDPILGSEGKLFYDPLFPPEVTYGTDDKRVIDKIRIYIGDPISIVHEYGEEMAANIGSNGMSYMFDNRGWPASVIMGGTEFNTTQNPTVNGYKYLIFSTPISTDTTYTTISGVMVGYPPVDIWLYHSRHSDREIKDAYDNCFPPGGLTINTATPEVYMLQTAIDLLYMELWEDATEDGAVIRDENSEYDPEAGLKVRKDLLDNLQDRLDELVKRLLLNGIYGVRID